MREPRERRVCSEGEDEVRQVSLKERTRRASVKTCLARL